MKNFVLLEYLSIWRWAPLVHVFIIACQTDLSENPPEEPVIYPNLIQDRLLTDEELITPELPYHPKVNDSYADWIVDNHNKIRSITHDEDFSDLAFLKEKLTGKRIVQLGESTHGSKEFNHIKVRLIKFMHEELGFNVIAFESSLMNCFYSNKEVVSKTPAETMSNSISGVWRTAEVIELFEYIKYTHTTDTPLNLAGIDVVATGFSDAKSQTRSALNPIASSYDLDYVNFVDNSIVEYFHLYELFLDCMASDQSSCKSFDMKYPVILENFEQVKNFFYSKREGNTPEGFSATDLDFADALIESSLSSIREMKSAIDPPSLFFEERDRGMAANANYLADKLYSDEKIILWAHNAHIATDYLEGISRYFEDRSLGFYLKEKWKSELYTVGLYMIRGESSDNIGEPKPVTLVEENSLEAIFYSLRLAAVYLHIDPNQSITKGNEWLFKPIRSKYWGGVSDEDPVLSKCYDAILMIDKSSLSARW